MAVGFRSENRTNESKALGVKRKQIITAGGHVRNTMSGSGIENVSISLKSYWLASRCAFCFGLLESSHANAQRGIVPAKQLERNEILMQSNGQTRSWLVGLPCADMTKDRGLDSTMNMEVDTENVRIVTKRTTCPLNG
eukprot:scaffold912_cov119-Cylindrotheca_fusiformis.AAC.3